MAKSTPMPQTLYVSRHNLDDIENEYFATDETVAAVIEDDGPTLVGTYQLVETSIVAKQIVKQPEESRARTGRRRGN